MSQIWSKEIFMEPCTFSLYLEMGFTYESQPFSRLACLALFFCTTTLLKLEEKALSPKPCVNV